MRAPWQRARSTWRWLALGLCLLLVAGWSPLAGAHAALIGSDPADGAVLSALPEHVALTFNEPVSPLRFSLVAPDGTSHALDRAVPVGAGVRVELPAQTTQGTYALSWRVVSTDGHPIGGAIVFSLGAASAAAAAPTAHYALRQPTIWLARLALYAGLFFGVGGVVFRAFLGDANAAATALPRRASWIGLAAVPVCLLLQGLDALEASWSRIVDPGVWRAALSTSYAATLALALLALVIARVTLSAVRAPRIRLGAAAAALALGAALAASGHASAAPPQWLARPAVLLHGIAVAAWLGALMPLLALARGRDGEIVPTLRVFSRRIGVVLIVLLASGLALALLQVDRPASLWTAPYGRILLAKLCLVAGLFALGWWNRYRLTGRVIDGNSRARLSLGRIITAEAVLALAVLAVVALWRFTPPPRTLAVATAATPSVLSIQFQSAAATAQISYTPTLPARPGSLRLVLTDARSAPLPAKAVVVSFANAAGGMEPLRREAVQAHPGEWEIAPLRLPAAARWDMRIDILVTDFDRIRLEGELKIPAAAHAR